MPKHPHAANPSLVSFSEMTRLETSTASTRDWRHQLFRPHTDKPPVLETPIAGGSKKVQRENGNKSPTGSARDLGANKIGANKIGAKPASKSADLAPNTSSSHEKDARAEDHTEDKVKGSNDAHKDRQTVPERARKSPTHENSIVASEDNSGAHTQTKNTNSVSAGKAHDVSGDKFSDNTAVARNAEATANKKNESGSQDDSKRRDQGQHRVTADDDVPAGRRLVDVQLPGRRQIDVNIVGAMTVTSSSGTLADQRTVSDYGPAPVRNVQVDTNAAVRSDVNSAENGSENKADGPASEGAGLEDRHKSKSSKVRKDGDNKTGRPVRLDNEDSFEVSTDSLSDAVKVLDVCIVCVYVY